MNDEPLKCGDWPVGDWLLGWTTEPLDTGAAVLQISRKHCGVLAMTSARCTNGLLALHIPRLVVPDERRRIPFGVGQ